MFVGLMQLNLIIWILLAYPVVVFLGFSDFFNIKVLEKAKLILEAHDNLWIKPELIF